MPSYFFHIKLELYPTPAANTESKRIARTHAIDKIYLPKPTTDIFKDSLPAHRTSKWLPRRPDNPRSQVSSDSEASPRRHPHTHQTLTESSLHGEALLLPERNVNLRDKHPQSPALAAVKRSNQASSKDWRYEAVSIESIDMEARHSKTAAANKATKSGVGGLHTKAVYLPSDAKTTDIGYGVVHLYRDTEESAVLGDDEFAARRSLNRPSGKHDADFDPEECTTVCILAVPSWMMPSDLLGFVGDQAREEVSHFRLIRTGRANKYMVLMKFRSAKKAREWQKAYNGRLFSAAEPENCHVVFIKSVEFLSADADIDSHSATFPQNTSDPFTQKRRTSGGELGPRTSGTLSSKPLAPPPPNLLELPTCPVCLERMDETTGLLTILCQHVFHCACLEKWRGSGCPVCRYTHSPSYTFPYPRPDHESGTESEPLCSVCASTSNLWICLICGNMGCGRYDSAHAYAHYEETSHCYAMDISSQHVWDYAGDGYVHRLIQSKPDTKLIDLPSRTRHENEAFRAEGGDSVPREKMESMANEYTYLLTSQLEGQRRYFEEQVERAVDKAAQASARAEEAAIAASRAVAQHERAQAEREELSSTVARLEAALAKSEKARQKFEQLARDMSSQLREEKTMNEGLVKRIRAAEQQAQQAQKDATAAEEKRKELEDLNHDLTMFISSQEKVKELEAQGEDVVEGTVGVPEPARRKNGRGGKKKS